MFIATLEHSSIHPRRMTVKGSLHAAKCRATRDWGDGFLDHTISIYEADDDVSPATLICRRRIADDSWTVWDHPRA